ncbi:S24/S26 family peptidase [Actinoplanes rectilineatus]|uniref:S24/S26 family peptidase n=1 Tax=Actinoplanes rectilineatus TaxID=113571 RepID=UPI0005F2A9C2
MRWQLPLFAVSVEGPSMVPALRHGDALVVLRTPRVRTGDIVVARFSGLPRLVVKRAVREQDGGWWVEGDNTFASDDSRVYGPADVVGRVLFRYYPRPWKLS